ncbi:MAG: DUF4336 domain-containing protein [Myxococcales bacterium]|nr:DUF4336 domain-containing protein [Myxococcales bacterium]
MTNERIEVSRGVIVEAGPVRFLGMKLESNMTIVAMGDGGLLVHSPIALTDERRAAVEALGEVRHLYAPNTFHHLWLEPWAKAFPKAKVHAPSQLAKKYPSVRVDRAHDLEREPAFDGVFDEVRVRGFELVETVLVHRASGSAVCADIVHNIGRPEHGWTRTYAKLAGFYDRVAISRIIRWTAFRDRRAARESVDELLALRFERLIVGHGAPIVEDARDQLASAYRWLE